VENRESGRLFERCKKVIPGGVNSPVRAFGPVGLTPPFIAKAKGSRIFDVDGNEYLDYVGSWGPMILGHARDEVIEAVIGAASRGSSFGAPTPYELELAEIICEAVPSIEMVRMTNSGTEAVMGAIRLARGFTGRDMILKFEGCYHGHSDGLLVKAGSGALTTGVPDSAGVPADYARNTLTASYNDCDGVERIFRESGDKIAAVIVEPVAGNMGVVNPKREFLELLRKITADYGALLIFDEVITGFRVAYGGAQQLFGIMPDITVLGKIIGGGMPVGAFGGRRDIMGMVSPSGPVYQAGTLSGNPVAMAAGSAVLKILRDNGHIYSELDKKGGILEEAFTQAGRKHGIPLTVNRTGSMLSAFFTDRKVDSYKEAVKTDKNMFVRYFKAMLERGIYTAPSPFEAMFVSHAHSRDDIKRTADAISEAVGGLRNTGAAD